MKSLVKQWLALYESQSEAAKAIGVYPSAVSQWARGVTNPSKSNRSAMRQALSTTPYNPDNFKDNYGDLKLWSFTNRDEDIKSIIQSNLNGDLKYRLIMKLVEK